MMKNMLFMYVVSWGIAQGSTLKEENKKQIYLVETKKDAEVSDIFIVED